MNTEAPRVLLTRDDAANAEFSAALASVKVDPISRPLWTYEATSLNAADRDIVACLDRYDHVIAISQNAVRYGVATLSDYWPQWPISIHWYAVGPTTGNALRSFDIEPIIPLNASSEGLLALPQLQVPGSGRVLILRGQEGRELLKQSLVDRGFSVDYLEVYRGNVVDYVKGAIGQDLGAHAFAMLYSGQAISRLAELLDSKTDLTVIVPSARLNMMALELGFTIAITASDQGQASMISALALALQT
ncbi:MAG: uroporphyrinogen-III synthase [Pseudomonadales bacterium]|nr:uroporphyrinogen-III synthase [Pseudomonadales bacterium]MDG1442641.1 uroporphyrinogen-III synthase [Pseudomonadales bacterium]